MKILYISQYYPPEPGAAAIRANEFTNNWIKKDIEVTVLTGFPVYLKGKIYKGYNNCLVSIEQKEKIKIVRTLTIGYPVKSLIVRAISQINFMFWVLCFGLVLRRYDVIIVSSPPFQLGVIGLVLGFLRNTPWAFEVRDLFPDSAIAFGVLKDRLLINILKKVEFIYYKAADLIVTATNGLAENIKMMNIENEKVQPILNGTNTDMFSPDNPKIDLLKYFDNPLIKKVIIYSGLIGKAHGVDKIIEVAKIMSDWTDVGFLFLGSGAEKKNIIQRSEDYGLKNVAFLNAKSYDEIPSYLSSSDLGIASVVGKTLTQKSIPVKIFDYMASGLPVLMIGRCEAGKIIERAKAGYSVEHNDLNKIAVHIKDILSDEDLKKKLAENGRKFVEENFSRKMIAYKYLDIIRAKVIKK